MLLNIVTQNKTTTNISNYKECSRNNKMYLPGASTRVLRQASTGAQRKASTSYNFIFNPNIQITNPSTSSQHQSLHSDGIIKLQEACSNIRAQVLLYIYIYICIRQ